MQCGKNIIYLEINSNPMGSESIMENITSDSTDTDSNVNSENADSVEESKSKKNSLSKRFYTLNIDSNIKNKAIQISEQLCFNSARSKKKSLLDFFCLYEAYKELNIQKDPFYIAELVGLESKYVKKALTLFSETQTKYHSTYNVVSPLDLIDDYSERLKFDIYKQSDIKKFAKDIIKRDKRLLDEMPRKVVSSILKLYMVINGIIYNKNDFEKAVGFSETTLNCIYKRIGNLY